MSICNDRKRLGQS